MTPRDLLTGEDDLSGTPAWQVLQWRARSSRPLPRLPFGLQKISCPGPPGGQRQCQAGIFEGIHGDEPAGTLAVQELAAWARRSPEELTGFDLHFFPVCNPSGARARTRHCGTGMDLNREFWTGSDQPEVRALEAELRTGHFNLIIALHEDDTSPGLYGFAKGHHHSQSLLEAALRAAGAVLPTNQAPVIDGFPSLNGIISEGYGGILSAPPEQRPQAAEIVFETPALAPQARRVAAAILAVKAILSAHRALAASPQPAPGIIS